MSQRYLNQLWSRCVEVLHNLAEKDDLIGNPTDSIDILLEDLTVLYLKYIRVVRDLDECYDQIQHPQKRLILRKILDGAIGRMLEIKHNIVDVQNSDVLILDHALEILKMTPDDAEIPIPHYILFDRRKILNLRGTFLKHLLMKLPITNKKEEQTTMSVKEAVLMIQRHERARQGRWKVISMKEMRALEHSDMRFSPRTAVAAADEHLAATKLQKAWRKTYYSSIAVKEREYETEWLEMIMPSTYWEFEERRHDERSRVLRRIRQVNNNDGYQRALLAVKDRIREQEASEKRDNLVSLIRQWYIEFRKVHGKFPDIPDVEAGGSDEIFTEKTPEELARIEEEAEAKLQKKKQKQKEKEQKMDKPKPVKPVKNKKDADDTPAFQKNSSRFLEELKEACQLYKDHWKIDDVSTNPRQLHDEKIIEDCARPEIHKEVRIQVDELMREELKNLKVVIDGEKLKKQKNKRAKGSKGRKGKKKEKDITSDRSIECLFEELALQGIIKEAKYTPIIDYIGDFGYLSNSLRNLGQEPQVTASDIRQLISEYAIIPLGCPAVHEKVPLIKSILLVGPEGVGKRRLVDIICTEAGANLIDLSGSNITGKYPGKDGLQMLMHLVFKVAKTMQPTVIFIDNCEEMFTKRSRKGQRGEGDRLKTCLPKQMKKITTDDRVLLIGSTSKPYTARLRPFCNLYNKIIMVPRPEYGSRRLLWEHFVTTTIGKGFLKKSAVDYSALAGLSDGYTSGDIISSVQAVLSTARIGRAKYQPIATKEFIHQLACKNPVMSDEEAKLKNWYMTTPMMKMRLKAIKEAEEALERHLEEAAKADSEQNKKKRKRK